MSLVICDIQKNTRETLRVGLEKYNGFDLLDLRVWIDAPEGGLRPTKAGINLRVHLLPQLQEAIAAAIDEARAHGLIA
jgi:hypothetical protein